MMTPKGMCEDSKKNTCVKAQDTYFQLIVEKEIDIVAILNAEAVIEYTNPALERILGYSESFLVQKQAFSFVHKEDVDRLKQVFHLGVQTPGLIQSVEFRFRHQNGTWRNLEAIGRSFKEGQRLITIVNARDITERKENEKELEKEQIKNFYSAKMAIVGQMASGIAHEINTPLAVVMGKIEQLKDALTEDSLDKNILRKYLDSLEGMVKRMDRIVRALRAFSRDASQDPFIESPLQQILEETLALSRERLQSKKVQLHLEPFAAELKIQCRPTEISQVLLNLLMNASDAIELLTDRWIRISINEQNDKVLIVVTDSGKGIPLSHQEKIFTPFFTTKESGKGTGLGLGISKNIIESHGGEMFLDDVSPNTCFVVSLPKWQGRHKKEAA